MRPVNLIPPEDRRGDRAPLRSGPLSYILVGVLAAILLGVTAMVMAQNDITDAQAEVEQLELDLEAATTEAASLASFAEFDLMRETRRLTISSLAQSRFDWERVLRELALIIPSDVTVSELSGAANGQVEGATTITAGESSGPRMSVKGCASGHDAVARFVAALEDIDGVTRVGLSLSEAPSTDSEEELCAFYAYELTVAFDNAPIVGAAVVPAAPAAPAAPPADPASTPAPAANETEQSAAPSAQANVSQGGS